MRRTGSGTSTLRATLWATPFLWPCSVCSPPSRCPPPALPICPQVPVDLWKTGGKLWAAGQRRTGGKGTLTASEAVDKPLSTARQAPARRGVPMSHDVPRTCPEQASDREEQLSRHPVFTV